MNPITLFCPQLLDNKLLRWRKFASSRSTIPSDGFDRYTFHGLFALYKSTTLGKSSEIWAEALKVLKGEAHRAPPEHLCVLLTLRQIPNQSHQVHVFPRPPSRRTGKRSLHVTFKF